jgi:hypothetical protein
MKTKANGAHVILLAGAALFFAAVPHERAQQNAAGHASDFNTVEYFDPPHERQVRSRVSGAEAVPQPGGLLVVKQFKLETFALDGKPEIVVTAPECVYDALKNMASSPGHLAVRTGDGKFRVEGEGFLWRQNDSLLTISNRVHTVIENLREMKTVL